MHGVIFGLFFLGGGGVSRDVQLFSYTIAEKFHSRIAWNNVCEGEAPRGEESDIGRGSVTNRLPWTRIISQTHTHINTQVYTLTRGNPGC